MMKKSEQLQGFLNFYKAFSPETNGKKLENNLQNLVDGFNDIERLKVANFNAMKTLYKPVVLYKKIGLLQENEPEPEYETLVWEDITIDDARTALLLQ